ncbi:DUF481 domain-containing protein [Pseudoxanthomonas suwonensis]|uniref:DUF481 domain-containing protein n=1 Tax=Pseudoxanthomonas suwonensis TaxID=314722 RepID=A0A0E3Z0P2_9GAMM|nr:DUF481 domain-containing protein [Pseudoxanthomonas suwonensis]AKC86109.1 hypothetical protein WQ53_04305 [Pseudoxanthomonas suwonensis]
MHHRKTALLLAALLPLAATAEDTPAPPTGWTGTGELGMAMTRGNSRTESLNAKLRFAHEDAQWKNTFGASALRARAQVRGDFDGDGTGQARYETSADRYELATSSAYKFNPRNHVSGSARYEHDSFSSYEYQATFAMGYGYRIEGERARLVAEAGPGYRRARETDTGTIRRDLIGRCLLDFRHRLTGNTDLLNTLLVESGSDNTFAQNDLNLAVAMNAHLALKAGVQARHNSQVDRTAGQRKTDTLTTINLVYNFR